MFAVRLATMDDADAIARLTSDVQQLHNQALPDIFKPPSDELFRARKLAALENPDCVVAVAEISGKVIGHIYGVVVRRAESEFTRAEALMYIQQIAIDERAAARHRYRACAVRPRSCARDGARCRAS